MDLLNLSEQPSDPLLAIIWLSGVQEQVALELDKAFGVAYFEARLQGHLEEAIAAGPYARKRVLAYTRHENESRGRSLRWGDRADSTSTAYYSG